MNKAVALIPLLLILCLAQNVAAQDTSTDTAAEDELHEVAIPKRVGVLKYSAQTISSLLVDKEIPFLGGRWGGEVMVDTPLNSQPIDATVTLRRAKLAYARGFGDNWKLRLTANYTKVGGLELDDTYLVYSGWKTALLKFGFVAPPYSLESASKSSAITFMERSLATVALSERESGGLMFLKRTSNHILNGMVAFLSPKDDNLRQSGEAVILHYVYSPINLAGRDNVHIGGSFSYRSNASQNNTRFRTLPEIATAKNYYVDTDNIDGADKVLRASFEASRVIGRFSWQTELFTAEVKRTDVDKTRFWGGYLYASWFLTNDSRNYDFGTGSFINVVPNKPLFKGGWAHHSRGNGWGALEVAARLSHVDLESGDINGGKQSNATLGLNWYLSESVRVMTNLTKVIDVKRPGNQWDGVDPLIFSLRAQWVIE